jgi:predicted DNA-binding WGR domain protein
VSNHLIHRRWETEARYYETIVMTDLFGDRVLVRRWGGKFSRLGGSRTTAVGEKSVNEGIKRVEAERRRKGYREV